MEVMVVDGKAHILQIIDKLTTGAPHFVEMGHSQPSRHPEEVKERIRSVAEAAVAAVGIDRGSAHVEMIVTARGSVMIELGARIGGDNITTHRVPLSTGIDMVEATIRTALGERPDITPRLHCGSAIRYFQAPRGIIRSIEGGGRPGAPDRRCAADHFTKNIGDESSPIHCSNNRIGFVIAQAATDEETVAICEKAMAQIKIITQ